MVRKELFDKCVGLLEESGLVKTEDAEVSAQEDELCGYPLAPEEVE